MNDLVPNRREFTKALAIIAAATAPAAACAAEKPDNEAYVDAIDTVIRYRFGKQLTAQQLIKVRSAYLTQRTSAESLRRIEITNGDDPIVAFRADLP